MIAEFSAKAKMQPLPPLVNNVSTEGVHADEQYDTNLA
jgi:hypothetical protein